MALHEQSGEVPFSEGGDRAGDASAEGGLDQWKLAARVFHRKMTAMENRLNACHNLLQVHRSSTLRERSIPSNA